MSTVKQISTLAKKIYAKKPTMKWTDAIKQASRELKASGKISAGKSRATKKTATRRKPVAKRKPVTKRITGVAKKAYKKYVVTESNGRQPDRIYIDINKINHSNPDAPTITIKNKKYRIWEDQDAAYGINWDYGNYKGGVYLYDYKTGRAITEHYYDDMSGVKVRKTPVKTRSKQPVRKKVNGSHTDTKSHNVRINVLSGLQGSPQVFNGVKTLTKGGYYLYMDKPNTLFKYIGKDTKKTAFPLIFDIYKKSSQGGYYLAARYEYASELIKYLSKIKKPTSKELAIGHLKLPK